LAESIKARGFFGAFSCAPVRENLWVTLSSMDVYRTPDGTLLRCLSNAEGSEMSLETKQQNEIGVYVMQVRVGSVAVYNIQ
jgi:hypothetical protein